MDMTDFCARVGRLVDENPEEAVPEKVAELMPALLADPTFLSPEQMSAPAKGYARHEVFLCPEDRFTVLAVVWPAGITSPIHDHNTWCAFGVYDGVVAETRYRPVAAAGDRPSAEPVSVRAWTVGEAGALPLGSGDIHGMHNPTDRASVSIHVYGGNIAKIGPNVGRVYKEVEPALA
jgi:predicted metal-dependent enzyme (double-stranded beta helix superfamily)